MTDDQFFAKLKQNNIECHTVDVIRSYPQITVRLSPSCNSGIVESSANYHDYAGKRVDPFDDLLDSVISKIKGNRDKQLMALG